MIESFAINKGQLVVSFKIECEDLLSIETEVGEIIDNQRESQGFFEYFIDRHTKRICEESHCIEVILFFRIKVNESGKNLKKIINNLSKGFKRIEEEHRERIKKEQEKMENNIKWLIKSKIVKKKENLEIIF